MRPAAFSFAKWADMVGLETENASASSPAVFPPLFSISSGALNDSDGDIDFACAKTTCTDGVPKPTYTNGRVINSSRAYVVLSLGVGIHFDVFGK